MTLSKNEETFEKSDEFVISHSITFSNLLTLFYMRIKPLYITLFIYLTFQLLSCTSDKQTDGLSLFSADSLKIHIQVLASDAFQGRRPFTAGETKTISYLEESFKNIGIKPGNGNSFIQEVPLVEITANAAEKMAVMGKNSTIELMKTDDFVVNTEQSDSIISLNKDELVFAGYGIVAPEYNWNDYANIDVKGKVVLVLVNDPGFATGDSTLFKGKTMTYYGRWTYKYEEAARQGAKACLIIHNTAAASYPFSVVQSSWGSSNLFLDKRDKDEYHCALQGWVSEAATKKLFEAGEIDMSNIEKASEPGFKAISMGVNLSLNVQVTSKYDVSKNIIGIIPGTKRPDEYIIYTAHWDHLGVGKPDMNGDSIYNGALDNASGTAALLEMARVFKNLKEQPERSIVFLAVTAEEQGLLGSDYYAKNPIFPLEKTVAVLNMDVLSHLEKANDINIAGAGQNDLEDYVAEVAKTQGRYIAPESSPEAGHYFRSDHFSFAKVGVPALSSAGGIDIIGKGKAYGQKELEKYNENQYHRQADNYDPKWKFEGGIQDMQMLFLIGNKLAHEITWPGWKNGSEFKELRK